MQAGSSWRRVELLLLGLLVSVRAAGAQGTPGEPKLALSFEKKAVVASGVTPGEKVAWFSVAREATGVGSRIVRREDVTSNTDKDGIARLDLGLPVPPRSIWAAIDMKTGAYVLATPGDYPLRLVPFPPGTVHPGAGGRLDRLFAEDREFVEFFVARPAVGAWALTVWDGASDDEDGPANRRISSSLASMEPAGPSPAAPDELKPGDVVIVMDPNAMQVLAARLAGGGQ